jgi:hypothetical protein
MVELNSLRVSKEDRKVQTLYKVRTGYFVINCIGGKISEVREERAIEVLPEVERELIELYTHIVYAMVFGVEDVLNENN